MSIIIKDASELGLPPGQFPSVIKLDGKEFARGIARRNADREVEVMTYWRRNYETDEREELHVLND